MLWQDHASNTQLLSRGLVIGFRVKSGIGEDDVDRDPSAGLLKQTRKLIAVQTGTFARSHGQHEMGRGIGDQTDQRIAIVDHRFPARFNRRSTFDEVSARRGGGQPARIHCGNTNASLTLHLQADRSVEQSANVRRKKKSLRRFLYGRKVGYDLKPDGLPQVRTIAELSDHASIIRSKETLQY